MTGNVVIDAAVVEMLRGLRLDGDRDPLLELSETFVVESTNRMRQLTGALAVGDETSVRRAAHCLKGMSATVGAMQLAEMSREIEVAGVDTIDGAHIEALEQEIARVAAALHSAATQY